MTRWYGGGTCSACGDGLPPQGATAHQCPTMISVTSGGAVPLANVIINPPLTDLHTECLSTISDLRNQISELTRSEAEYKQAYDTSHRQNCDLTATIHQLTERLENTK